ncbi:MAG: ATP synthase F1 subunit gamma [bacterium]
MANLRDIRRRIGSVSSTMQITNAMKMVSTAKLNRAQNAARASQPYAAELRRMATSISSGLTGEDHPFFNQPEGGVTAIVLFTSDRGLCGAFNNNLCKEVLRQLRDKEAMPDPEVIPFGRKGADYFRRRGVTLGAGAVQIPLAEKEERIGEVVDQLVERFIGGEVGRVFVAYNQYKSAMTQYPIMTPLLPIVPPKPEEAPGAPGGETSGADERPADEREVLFEPSRHGVLELLLPSYVENQMFQALLNTEAGEHGARMVAMDGATRNAEDMISSLTLQANKARQASITTELIEIVAGAEAL